MLLAAATATATTKESASTSLAAAPFAQSWANVPRTEAARKAKDVVVFGQEQDIDGFNTALTCCGQFWAGVQTVPVLRGAYNITNKLEHVLDLVSIAKAAKTTLSYTIRKDANWNWGGQKLPVTYKDFVYTWQQLVDPKNDISARNGYELITRYTHKGAKQITFTWKRPYAVGGARRPGLHPHLDELHLRQRRQARLGRPVPAHQLHEGTGLDAHAEPVLVRPQAGAEDRRVQDHHATRPRRSGC